MASKYASESFESICPRCGATIDLSRLRGHMKTTLCKEEGEKRRIRASGYVPVFDSVADRALALGVPPAKITKRVRRGRGYRNSTDYYLPEWAARVIYAASYAEEDDCDVTLIHGARLSMPGIVALAKQDKELQSAIVAVAALCTDDRRSQSSYAAVLGFLTQFWGSCSSPDEACVGGFDYFKPARHGRGSIIKGELGEGVKCAASASVEKEVSW